MVNCFQLLPTSLFISLSVFFTFIFFSIHPPYILISLLTFWHSDKNSRIIKIKEHLLVGFFISCLLWSTKVLFNLQSICNKTLKAQKIILPCLFPVKRIHSISFILEPQIFLKLCIFN